ncbi:MAG: hypothetical protein ACR2KV_14770 [Solirubrobacteraceae bacterium]
MALIMVATQTAARILIKSRWVSVSSPPVRPAGSPPSRPRLFGPEVLQIAYKKACDTLRPRPSARPAGVRRCYSPASLDHRGPHI